MTKEEVDEGYAWAKMAEESDSAEHKKDMIHELAVALDLASRIEEEPLKGLKGEIRKGILPFSYESTISNDGTGTRHIESKIVPNVEPPMLHFDLGYIRQKIKSIKDLADDVELWATRAWEDGKGKRVRA